MTRLRVLLPLLALFLAAASLNAQVDGVVTGSVIDSTGAAVPEAAVSLHLPGATAAVFTTKTTATGTFTILSVPANKYDLVIEAKGFLKAVRTGIDVLPDRSFDVP